MGDTGTDRAATDFALPHLPARLAQIDLLKGLAILSVLVLHALTATQLADSAARFWIGQAVPVFVVLMGLNATSSMWPRGGGQAYVRCTRGDTR